MRSLIALLVAASTSLVLGKECTVTYTEGQDDTPAIIDAFTQCATDSIITFEAKNYSAYTPVSLVGLSNVTVHLNGNLLLPNNITAIQQAINASSNQKSTYATPWFYIHGENVELIGSNQSEWGAFHGFGQQWWNVNNKTLRPQLATFNVTNGSMTDLKVIQPIAWGFNIPGQNVIVRNHYVHAKPDNGTRGDTHSFPFNTDGFNLSGRNITIDGYTGWNGDDCVSVVNGARDITAKNGFCGFSSHGLSIGSLGKGGANSTVENVAFHNWTMDGAVYGARFKSWTGGNGYAKNVTWSDIKLVNVSTAIYITQNYYDQDFGKPANATNTSTHVEHFRFNNFSGFLQGNWTDGTCISNPCWNFVSGIDGTQSIILDLYEGTATDMQFQNINVSTAPGSGKNTTVLCDPNALASGEQDTLGFKCANGAFSATTISTSEGSEGGGKNAALGGYPGTLWALVATLATAGLFW